MKKNDRMSFLTILLTVISVSIVMVSLPTANPSEDFSEDLNLSASSTNYTIGVLPNECNLFFYF